MRFEVRTDLNDKLPFHYDDGDSALMRVNFHLGGVLSETLMRAYRAMFRIPPYEESHFIFHTPREQGLEVNTLSQALHITRSRWVIISQIPESKDKPHES